MFDNCVSPQLASTYAGFVEPLSHTAQHIRDLPCGRHATDEQWIRYLPGTREKWAVFTGDERLLKNKAERAALRAAGLLVFILAPAYQKTPVHQQASHLLWRWPDVEQIIGLINPPAIFRLPMRRSGKLDQIPL
jgi:hypothetical protein